MSLPSIRDIPLGKLHLSIYDYAKAGDTLPMHQHDTTTEHAIIVARGRITLRVQDTTDGSIAESTHMAGAVIDTHAGWPHEIVGLDDGSRSIHIRKMYFA